MMVTVAAGPHKLCSILDLQHMKNYNRGTSMSCHSYSLVQEMVAACCIEEEEELGSV